MNMIMLSNQVFKIKMGSKYAPKRLELLLYQPKGFSFWGTSSPKPHSTTMFYISAKLNNFDPDIKYLISIFAWMLAIEHGLEPCMLSFISYVYLKYAPK